MIFRRFSRADGRLSIQLSGEHLLILLGGRVVIEKTLAELRKAGTRSIGGDDPQAERTYHFRTFRIGDNFPQHTKRNPIFNIAAALRSVEAK
jgi:hypothetical protein